MLVSSFIIDYSVGSLNKQKQLALYLVLELVRELGTVNSEHLLVTLILEQPVEGILHEENSLVLQHLCVSLTSAPDEMVPRYNVQ